jgi:hypothetical protein
LKVSKRVGPLLRHPRTVPESTVIDAFKPRRRRLDFDLVVAIVRALGLDDAEVARWRAACVRVHAQAAAHSGVLRYLPADLATFTGREDAVKVLLDSVLTKEQESPGDGTVIVLRIEGMGGIGKSKLAVHVAHQLVRKSHYGAQLYVDLHGFDPKSAPTDPADVLACFLGALGVPARQIPAGLDDRAAMFRHRIRGRAALLVLDDAVDEDQVRPLIPADSACVVLVTSRRSLAALDGADLYTLDTFSVLESVELLAAIVGRERIAAEPAEAERVAELCGCLPLAVALAAARLRGRSSWSVADLAARLADGAHPRPRRRVVNPAADPRTDHRAEAVSLSAGEPAWTGHRPAGGPHQFPDREGFVREVILPALPRRAY